MIKIVTIDLDGTLLDKDKNISFKNKTAIAKCHDLGVKIVIATGRPLNGVTPILEELGLTTSSDYVIVYNGSKIVNVGTKEIISASTIKGTVVKELYEESKRLGLNIHAFRKNEELITPCHNPYTNVESKINHIEDHLFDFNKIDDNDDFIKCMLVDSEENITMAMTKVDERFSREYTMVRSSKIFLEFLHIGIEKGSALKSLASYLNVKIDETMAIGDAGNDMTMIQAAGIGVAMNNAFPEVKEIADYITNDDNNNSGVAEALNKFIIMDR